MAGNDIEAEGSSPFRAPSGWVPMILAVTALALLGGYLLTGPHDPNLVTENGITREDEGPAARLWQLLMVAQLFAIVVFAVRWLPKSPRPAVALLILQGLMFAASALPVYLLER